MPRGSDITLQKNTRGSDMFGDASKKRRSSENATSRNRGEWKGKSKIAGIFLAL